MQDSPKSFVSRRNLFRAGVAVAGVVAIGTVAVQERAANAFPAKGKRKVRYQADSAEVRNFYRVNSYPAR